MHKTVDGVHAEWEQPAQSKSATSHDQYEKLRSMLLHDESQNSIKLSLTPQEELTDSTKFYKYVPL